MNANEMKCIIYHSEGHPSLEGKAFKAFSVPVVWLLSARRWHNGTAAWKTDTKLLLTTTLNCLMVIQSKNKEDKNKTLSPYQTLKLCFQIGFDNLDIRLNNPCHLHPQLPPFESSPVDGKMIQVGPVASPSLRSRGTATRQRLPWSVLHNQARWFDLAEPPHWQECNCALVCGGQLDRVAKHSVLTLVVGLRISSALWEKPVARLRLGEGRESEALKSPRCWNYQVKGQHAPQFQTKLHL